jgi:hypothetical protein
MTQQDPFCYAGNVLWKIGWGAGEWRVLAALSEQPDRGILTGTNDVINLPFLMSACLQGDGRQTHRLPQRQTNLLPSHPGPNSSAFVPVLSLEIH